MLIQPGQHFLLDALYVGELAPPHDVVVFPSSFNLLNEFLHERQAIRGLFPEVLFAHLRRLLLPVLGSQSHIHATLPGHVAES